MTSSQPLIVLDVDGVLNSTRSMLLTGPVRNDHENLDPIAVRLLDRVCEASNAHVAIISTWRDEFPDPVWWNALFARYDAPHVNVVACLPRQPRHRGTLLQAWLEAKVVPHEDLVILDDSADYLDGHPLVLVNPDVGLSAENVVAALRTIAPTSDLLKRWSWWTEQDPPSAHQDGTLPLVSSGSPRKPKV